MALKHLATVLCDNLIVSAHDGRPSFIGSFLNVAVRQFPAGKDPMGVSVTFLADPGDEYSIWLEGPQTKAELGKGVVEAPDNLVSEHQRWAAHVHVVAAPMVFPAAGVYRIVLRSGEEAHHSFEFGVFLRGDETQPEDTFQDTRDEEAAGAGDASS